MNEKIKKTALETSAGTDEKQSLINSKLLTFKKKEAAENE